ncbi:MAG: D-alanyl-D-alanine carboxypeptidase [Desulfitobacterium hafniense]|nr:D-alanyl-D-alanine carboxypeptidase [Desulfitobacterium hafniense]
MKRIIALFIVICFIFTRTIPVKAGTNEQDLLPEIHGEAAILIDVKSGQILFNKNSDKQLAPASTTKIMTGLLAIESGKLQETVTTTQTMLDYKTVYGTRIYLEPGETLLMSDLLYALLLNSANDSAVAIAEHISGSVKDFAELMNRRAKELGALNTNFVNPSGLTESGHYTTANDLALIARAAYQNPVFAEYVRTKKHTIPRVKAGVPSEMVNENKLLWRDESVTGIKTGYTMAAGNCLVASASKDGRELIGVILKSPGKEIYTDMLDLFQYGFSNYDTTIYMDANSSVGTMSVNDQEINLLLASPIWITKKQDALTPELQFNVVKPEAPLTTTEVGQIVARLEVRYDEKLLNIIPLKADRTILMRQNHSRPSFITSYGLVALLGVILLLLGCIKVLFRKKYYMRSYARRESNQ